MNKIKLWSMLFALVMVATTAQAVVRPLSYIDLDTGYRWDKVYHRFVVWNDGLNSAANPVRVNDLNSFQLGAKVQSAICSGNWFVRGSGHYGWVYPGDFQEGGLYARVKGHTVDASASTGYYFSFHPCWGLGPVIGYAYDQMHLHTSHLFQNTSGGDVDNGGMKLTQTFQGPFVGLDLLFQPSCLWQVELEWNLIHGWWEFRDSYDVLTRASKRTHHNVWGNVFQVDTTYILSRCWSIGLELSYETRVGQGNQGHYKRTIVPLAFANQKIQSLSWQSFSTMFHVGYNF